MKTEKHNHKFTNCLKGIIFSIMMLLPFIAIGTTSAYVIFNKNAKDSYSGDYIFQEKTTIDPNTEIVGNNYYYGTTNTTIAETKPGFYKVKNFTQNQYYNLDFEIGYIAFDTWSANAEITFFENNLILDKWNIGNGRITIDNIELKPYNTVNVVKQINGTKYISTHLLNNPINIEFTFIEENNYGLGNSNTTAIKTNFEIKNIIKNAKQNLFITDNTLSNVFYAQADKIWKAPIFSWVMNGPFYAGMTAFTGLFGIPNQTFFSNLLVYWLTIVCIYIIIDVILEVFIFLSHFLFEKKADL